MYFIIRTLSDLLVLYFYLIGTTCKNIPMRNFSCFFQINFVLVMIYVLTSPYHSLNATQAFTALSIVNILRFPIALCPFLVNGAVQVSSNNCCTIGYIFLEESFVEMQLSHFSDTCRLIVFIMCFRDTFLLAVFKNSCGRPT